MVRVGTLLQRCTGSVWRTSVREALSADHKTEAKTLRVQGWVKSVRKQKQLIFIDLSDGSSRKNLQVVAEVDKFPEGQSLTLGCSVAVEGVIVPSTHPQQPVELIPSVIELIGECNANEYPFKARTRYSMEFARQFLHLRPRTDSFAAMLRLRNIATMAVHDFFQSQGFLHVHTPILTSNDCEGGGDLFQVMPARDIGTTKKTPFFNSTAFLTVSGQLHAEAITCGGMSRVYTFGPTFRAEKSHTRRHLSEFNMVEAEMVVEQRHSLEQILEVTEDICKHTTNLLLTRGSEDVDLFHRHVASPDIKNIVNNAVEKPYKRVTYTEAVDILCHAHEKTKFQFPPMWGADLSSEHEAYLVKHFGQQPIFVIEFPLQLKPFYARSKDNHEPIALSADLLMPGVGEVAGGTVREERLSILQQKLSQFSDNDNYQWYLELRQFGTMPHGGFGLGFERLIQAVLGVENIRDAIPFPRYLGSCPL